MSTSDETRLRNPTSRSPSQEEETGEHEKLAKPAAGSGSRRFPLQGKPQRETVAETSPPASALVPGAPPQWKRGPPGLMPQHLRSGSRGQGGLWADRTQQKSVAPMGPRQFVSGRSGRQGSGGVGTAQGGQFDRPGLTQRQPESGDDREEDNPANPGPGGQRRPGWRWR
jgi:hypothetical protein